MRDVHSVEGKKVYYDDLDVALEGIRKIYPTATKQGSVGAWSWSVGDMIVAEAWLHRDRPGWWVRIKKPA